ncbi:MAG: hypothetical protein KF861_22100 [Planctomycetaceae bacterium]|nr:hypothetical protein [Planctomycetaceae bacterium]
MPPRMSPTAPPNDSVALREELVELRQQVALLSVIIDELREELSWLTRNGLPPHADAAPSPVLRRMALDPCADDWRERLAIARGEPVVAPPASSPTQPATPGKPPPGKLFSTPGDQPKLF